MSTFPVRQVNILRFLVACMKINLPDNFLWNLICCCSFSFPKLGVFYAYTEEYKHSNCFFKIQNKPLQYVQHKTSQNFKMSVNCTYRYVCCEMNGLFFNVFINHFPKIHRSVLCKIAIDPLYFWDIYDIYLWEKNYSRSTTYKAKAVFPITYFEAEAVIGRCFSKIVVLQCSFFALIKAWKNVCDRFHYSLFISSSSLLFY